MIRLKAKQGKGYVVQACGEGVTISRRGNTVHICNKADVLALFDAIATTLRKNQHD